MATEAKDLGVSLAAGIQGWRTVRFKKQTKRSNCRPMRLDASRQNPKQINTPFTIYVGGSPYPRPVSWDQTALQDNEETIYQVRIRR